MSIDERSPFIVSSPPFKFIVGTEQEEFTVQHALVAHHSKSLGVLMDSDSSKTENGRAYLESTDPDTFVRFCEFAYTGNYEVPKPEEIATRAVEHSGAGEGADEGINDAKASRETVDMAEVNIKPQQVMAWGQPIDNYDADYVELEPDGEIYRSFGTKSKKKGKKRTERVASPIVSSQRERLWDVFRQGLGTSTPPSLSHEDQGAWNDYTKVFLAHARLCQFADERLIDPLAELTARKLRAVLATAEIYPQQLNAVVSLLEYVYAKDGRTSKVMRDMVANYAACILEYFKDHEGFRALLKDKDKADFSQDLVKYTIMRLE
ncbi:MAG: hypothetical protein Q9160_004438 [Pyrenula sp. 1 TL-2023]